MADFIDREAITEYLMGRIKDYLEMDDRLATIPLKFAMAYIQHLPSADVEPVKRWIPCREALPNTRERVLATDGVFVGEMCINKRGQWERYNVTNYETLMSLDILAWMPLPEPPEMDGGAENAAD